MAKYSGEQQITFLTTCDIYITLLRKNQNLDEQYGELW